jgi:hypothetical protein
MTEKLTCGRLGTFELCSRCLLHLPLRRTVVCVHICYTHHTRVHAKSAVIIESNYAVIHGRVRLKVNVGFWRWWRLVGVKHIFLGGDRHIQIHKRRLATRGL